MADERFTFTGPNGGDAWCHVEVLPLADGRTAVIATERADNPGMSITNASEAVAAHACRHFGIDPRRLAWIEHYDADSYVDVDRPESFDAVVFHHTAEHALRCPSWQPMSAADWRHLGLPARGVAP